MFYGRPITVGWSTSTASADHSSFSAAFSGMNDDNSNAGPLSTNADPNNTSLFVGNVPTVDFPVQELIAVFNTPAVACHHGTGKNFAFLNMPSHQIAYDIIKESLTNPGRFFFKGKQLQISWGKVKNDTHATTNKIPGLIGSGVPPSDSIKTLFIGGLPEEKSASENEFMLKSMIKEIINVKIPEGKNFAFAEFQTNEDAQQVINSISASPISMEGKELVFGWAKGQFANTHNQDCWFCLASTSVKTHLIVR